MQSRYRPGVTRRVPGSYGSQITRQRHRMVVRLSALRTGRLCSQEMLTNFITGYKYRCISRTIYFHNIRTHGTYYLKVFLKYFVWQWIIVQCFLIAVWPSIVSVIAKVFLRIFERAFWPWWNNAVSLSLDFKLTTEFKLSWELRLKAAKEQVATASWNTFKGSEFGVTSDTWQAGESKLRRGNRWLHHSHKTTSLSCFHNA